MARLFTKAIKGLFAILLTIVLVAGALVVAMKQGWLSPFGINSETSDSQVVQAIKRTQEVSLVSMHIQGLKSEKRDREILGQTVPGSGETVFLQYEFDAKLGLDGADVVVDEVSPSIYTVSVPEFRFIGYSDPTFEVATEDNGVLSWTTPDIDKVEMASEIFNDDTRQTYLDEQKATLEDQTKVFYDSLISSVDPAATTSYTFSS